MLHSWESFLRRQGKREGRRTDYVFDRLNNIKQPTTSGERYHEMGIDRLVRIAKGNFPIYAKRILEIENLSFPSPWSSHDFRREIEKSITHLWALIIDRNLEGYICFWLSGDEVQITNFAVHPKKRGQRLGQFILTGMIERWIFNKMKWVRLEVRPSNLEAKGLYSKVGFHEVGRCPRYYKDTGEDAIIMALELPRSVNRRSAFY